MELQYCIAVNLDGVQASLGLNQDTVLPVDLETCGYIRRLKRRELIAANHLAYGEFIAKAGIELENVAGDIGVAVTTVIHVSAAVT